MPPFHSPRRSPAAATRTVRSGFTLLEVLLAVILIDVGLLALVGGSAVLMRRASELRRRGVALRAANERIQMLSFGACAAASGTSAGPLGIQEAWAVALPSSAIRDLRDSVVYYERGAPHSVVLRTRLAC